MRRIRKQSGDCFPDEWAVAVPAGGEFDGADVGRGRVHGQMDRCRHWRRPCGPCLRACLSPSPRTLIPFGIFLGPMAADASLSTSRFNGPSARR
jgi:hypothetical protein